jgi:hypothetical protein
MKRWLILFMVGCLALAGAANAAVQQGDTELDAMGAWMTQNGSGDSDLSADFDAFFLMARVGYFVTDNVQVAGVGMGAWTSTTVEVSGSSADIDVDIYGLGVSAKYHFMPTNQWVPYVGGQLLWTNLDLDASDISSSADDSADGMMWGPVAGLRYELNAYNDFFVEYQYHIWSGDAGDVLDDGHALFVGLVHQFK